ncbi:MAG: DUF1292 domain-containing protein, partial [Clostridia bacterium]|nr:DUF1292 domain-containing protein [Clostridia bacterium]
MADKKDLRKDIEEIEEEEEVIVLMNEETGEEVEFSLLAMLEVDDETYAYLEPVEDVEGFEEGDLLINRVEFDENGEEKYLPIDDEDELDRAFEAFDAMYVEQFGTHADGTPVED